MASINKVILLGHLGADPETRQLANGDSVCNLRLATTEKWKDKASGEARETTEWHRVVLFRNLADIAARYLNKGALLFIEGRIRTRKWKDKDGQDRYSTEIDGSELKMLGSSSAGQGQKPGQTGSGAARPVASPRPDPWDELDTRRSFDEEDTIPF